MEQDKTVNNIEGGAFAVQFVIASSPTITPLRIVVLCADALQGCFSFLDGCSINCL